MIEDNTAYRKDGAALVIDILKEVFGESGVFKAFFNGQPEQIPESLLPCIMVSEGQGEITTGASGTDDIQETINIILAMNKRDDVGASPDTDLTELKLRRLIKGQHPTTKEYLPNTVMYALRRYITINDEVLSSRVLTNFEPNIRGEDTVTSEANVTVLFTRMAMVPQRS